MPEEKNPNDSSPSNVKRRSTLWVDPRHFQENDAGVNMSQHLDDYGVNRFLSRYYLPLLVFVILVILGIGAYIISKML